MEFIRVVLRVASRVVGRFRLGYVGSKSEFWVVFAAWVFGVLGLWACGVCTSVGLMCLARSAGGSEGGCGSPLKPAVEPLLQVWESGFFLGPTRVLI